MARTAYGRRYIPKAKKHEEPLQIRVATYLKRHFPTVIFMSSAAGLYLTMPQAVKMKRMNTELKMPDLYLFAPSADGRYAGMCIELKADHVKTHTRTGELVASEHIREQARCHELLREEGYWADFAIGYDDCIDKIHEYLGAKQEELF